ncbi:2-oxoglutarate and iron-dependent oxygenase domain-containing protein, partial [Streptomyces sp. NPDC048551]|uniref:2-oxoglutarate and iron-dependent oxygenase domain-containing protein n=1 Tax=Streptomyces sp. NPDC048551 TaxID=3155758 RepID=UPI003435BBAF
MVSSQVPVIDLGPWRSGDPAARARIAARVDEALKAAGFLLVTGHGVDPALPARIRAEARTFFRLPPAAKRPYAVSVGGRGWLGPGAEAPACAPSCCAAPTARRRASSGAWPTSG